MCRTVAFLTMEKPNSACSLLKSVKYVKVTALSNAKNLQIVLHDGDKKKTYGG